MFVLAYRNANGSLRVSPRAYATAAQAGGFAKYYSRKSAEFHNSGLTFTIIDLTDIVDALNAKHDAHIDCLNDCESDGYCCDCGNCFACTIGGCQACYWDVCPEAAHQGSLSPYVG